MKVQQIPINKIKPDPNQPRKSLNGDTIEEMAKSILTEGLINPIEIDKDYVIVTGEIRWRAAKEAGLKEIPCRILNIKGRERFRRQVIENIHHNTMTAWDTAVALENLLLTPLAEIKERKDAGIRKLALEIGKSDVYILDHLNLLKEDNVVQEWLKTKDSKYSLIRDSNKAPKEFRDILKKKIIKGEINKYDTVLEMVGALNRNPEKAKQLFDLDFQKPALQTVSDIHRVSPPPESRYQQVRKGTSLVEDITYLIGRLKKTRYGELLEPDKIAIKKLVSELIIELNRFISIDTFIEGEVLED